MSLPVLKAPPKYQRELEESLLSSINVAVRDPSYVLIFVGFFSCGFQLAFITAHFPAFVTEACATIDPNGLLAKMGIKDTADLGAFSIAVIGIFNIAGDNYRRGPRRSVPQASSSCGYLHGQDCIVFLVYFDTYDPVTVLIFFIAYRFSLARDSASDVWTRGLYLRTEVHGYPVWLSVPVAPGR